MSSTIYCNLFGPYNHEMMDVRIITSLVSTVIIDLYKFVFSQPHNNKYQPFVFWLKNDLSTILRFKILNYFDYLKTILHYGLNQLTQAKLNF